MPRTDPVAPSSRRRPRFAFLLSVALRRIEAAAQGASGSKSHARFGLLMALPADGADLPLARLGAVLDLSPSSLSGLVDRMVRDGLLERQPDPDDGRAWNIRLTEAGRAARSDAVRAARKLNDRLCEGFDPKELEIVARWLEAVQAKFPKE